MPALAIERRPVGGDKESGRYCVQVRFFRVGMLGGKISGRGEVDVRRPVLK
jgi:hypothetical protein